uniref:F-box protein At5g52880 n=3 Tax=Rhizophora mucronata TaxID=61149 RepID=A0A2P2K3N0_RHIMU
MRCDPKMSDPKQRYQKLGFQEGLSRSHHYPVACKELSLILREAYNKVPKNLQSTIFQDILSAFRLLPEMQTRSAISAAHGLFQSTEAVLPKQKKNLAATEFRHAMVAHKRRSKSNPEEERTVELPQDIIVDIFSFLDMQSLVAACLVCRSWNSAASHNNLWQSQFAIYFDSNLNSSQDNELQNAMVGKDGASEILQDSTTGTSIDWREAFKRAYLGNSSKKLTSNRGYCDRCEAIVWLSNMKCCNEDCKLRPETGPIMPVSSYQVVDYLLNGSSSLVCSSDSDCESDDGLISRLWWGWM